MRHTSCPAKVGPMNRSKIVAAGCYQPSRILTNDELSGWVDTNDEWIRSRVGISERRIAGEDEGVVDLAAAAAERIMDASGLSPADLDLIVVATTTADVHSPNTACQVAARLGIVDVPAYDINSACSGFNYALTTADQAIRSGSVGPEGLVLVIAAEKLSAVTDWSDRTSCVLVGDGAGGVLLRAASPSWSGHGTVYPGVWGSVPAMSSAVVIDGQPPRFHQDGRAVFRWATTVLPGLARKASEAGGFAPEDLAGFVPHQANLRIVEPLAAKLGLSTDAVVARDVVVSGNTSAASVPIAFAKLVESGALPSGSPVLLFGFGGGLSYAGQVVRTP